MGDNISLILNVYFLIHQAAKKIESKMTGTSSKDFGIKSCSVVLTRCATPDCINKQPKGALNPVLTPHQVNMRPV